MKIDAPNVKDLASKIVDDLRALPVQDTPQLRQVRREYSKALKEATPEFVLALADELIEHYGLRWIAYELIRNHRAAFQSLSGVELERLGQGIDSWDSVDAFARTLAGPAWLAGLVSSELIHKWALSGDRWWRRAALVSTVALNVRSRGGYGDAPRTLDVCRLLAGDQDDMVVKALSWVLRELVVHDPGAVRGFLAEHDGILAARVKREVSNKLVTGLKNPKSRPKLGIRFGHSRQDPENLAR